MGEFRPGGTMLSVRLKDGRTYSGLIVSTCQWFIGHAKYDDIPFDVAEIQEVFQISKEQNPKKPETGWIFWQEGCKAAGLKRFLKTEK